MRDERLGQDEVGDTRKEQYQTEERDRPWRIVDWKTSERSRQRDHLCGRDSSRFPLAQSRIYSVCGYCRIDGSRSQQSAPPSLSDRSCTGDEDIDQSPRALLPVRAGRHIGNADQSAKEIDRVKVSTYVAVFDGAFHQGADRFPHLRVRSFKHLLGISNQGIQRRRDDLLRRDVVHEQQHPGSQGFNRGHRLGKVPLRSGQLFDLRPINHLNQRLARRKMSI
jgi:hypothetical protein